MRDIERLLISKLQDHGWIINFSDSKDSIYNLMNSNLNIKVEIKISESNNPRLDLQVNKKADYLIIANKKDFWIIPKYMGKNTDRPQFTLKKLKNKLSLLKVSANKLLSEVNDCEIAFSEILKPSLLISQKHLSILPNIE